MVDASHQVHHTTRAVFERYYGPLNNVNFLIAVSLNSLRGFGLVILYNITVDRTVKTGTHSHTRCYYMNKLLHPSTDIRLYVRL